jgi:raffinose/stachyose/melibiose transport system permease protein
MHLITRSKWPFLAALAPAVTVYTLFAIVPIFVSFYYSLVEWNGFTDMKFVGLANFAEAFKDSVFWSSLTNNLYVVAASVFGQVPIALMIALLLNRRWKGSKFFRTVGFLPVVISTVVVSLVWGMIFNARRGLINQMLSAFGLEEWRQNWLGDPKLAMMAVCITIIWQFVGLYLIIFLAALQNIPGEIDDAARIDGASGLKQTIYITRPRIWETIMVAVILCISGSLRTFDLIYVMTSGGPGHATEVLATYMFDKTFSSTRYGYGSAISVCIFFFSLILIWLSNLMMRRKTI